MSEWDLTNRTVRQGYQIIKGLFCVCWKQQLALMWQIPTTWEPHDPMDSVVVPPHRQLSDPEVTAGKWTELNRPGFSPVQVRRCFLNSVSSSFRTSYLSNLKLYDKVQIWTFDLCKNFQTKLFVIIFNSIIWKCLYRFLNNFLIRWHITVLVHVLSTYG